MVYRYTPARFSSGPAWITLEGPRASRCDVVSNGFDLQPRRRALMLDQPTSRILSAWIQIVSLDRPRVWFRKARNNVCRIALVHLSSEKCNGLPVAGSAAKWAPATCMQPTKGLTFHLTFKLLILDCLLGPSASKIAVPCTRHGTPSTSYAIIYHLSSITAADHSKLP